MEHSFKVPQDLNTSQPEEHVGLLRCLETFQDDVEFEVVKFFGGLQCMLPLRVVNESLLLSATSDVLRMCSLMACLSRLSGIASPFQVTSRVFFCKRIKSRAASDSRSPDVLLFLCDSFSARKLPKQLAWRLSKLSSGSTMRMPSRSVKVPSEVVHVGGHCTIRGWHI